MSSQNPTCLSSLIFIVCPIVCVSYIHLKNSKKNGIDSYKVIKIIEETSKIIHKDIILRIKRVKSQLFKKSNEMDKLLETLIKKKIEPRHKQAIFIMKGRMSVDQKRLNNASQN